ncbi:cell division protein FtsQ/DivIB [Lactobacillus sp. AN1001]
MTEQRKKALRQQALFPLVFFSIMTLLTLCLILPISCVRSVTVDSNDKQLRVAVIKASGLHYYESLFNVWFNASKIEDKIQSKVGLVEQATLRYVNVNNVVIDVKEEPQVGYIYRNNKYYKIGTTGQPLSEGTTSVKGSYPVFYAFKDKAKLKLAVTKVQELPTELKKSVSEIHYDPSKVNPNRIKLYMNDGNEVIADLSTLTKKMEYYPQIATKMDQKGIVDLEVGAFSYPKN